MAFSSNKHERYFFQMTSQGFLPHDKIVYCQLLKSKNFKKALVIYAKTAFNKYGNFYP